jgi:hypothetical protein
MLIREQWAPILFQPHENYITDDLGKYYMCITSVVTAVISYTMMNSSWYQDSNIGSTTSPHSRICTSPNPQPPCFPHGGSGDFAQEKFQFTRPEKLHTRSEVDLSTHTHTRLHNKKNHGGLETSDVFCWDLRDQRGGKEGH